jgi:hypothetical protein
MVSHFLKIEETFFPPSKLQKYFFTLVVFPLNPNDPTKVTGYSGTACTAAVLFLQKLISSALGS